MRLYYIRSTLYALAHTSPERGDPGFSKIIEGPSGLGCASKRRAGCVCPGSAAIRRHAYSGMAGVSGPGCARLGIVGTLPLARQKAEDVWTASTGF